MWCGINDNRLTTVKTQVYTNNKLNSCMFRTFGVIFGLILKNIIKHTSKLVPSIILRSTQRVDTCRCVTDYFYKLVFWRLLICLYLSNYILELQWIVELEVLLDYNSLGTLCWMSVEWLGCRMGVGGSNTGCGKSITSANNADRHWGPHFILVMSTGGFLATA